MLGFIWGIIIGGLSGCIAGAIMKSSGGLIRNIILGIVGGFVGSLIFGLLGFQSARLVGQIISSVVGACLIIFIGRKIFK